MGLYKIVAPNIQQRLFGLKANVHERFYMGHKKVGIEIYSAILVAALESLGVKSGAGEKRVPPFIYGLSKAKIASFLRRYFSGDGSFYPHHLEAVTKSRGLANDLLYLFLVFGLVARVK